MGLLKRGHSSYRYHTKVKHHGGGEKGKQFAYTTSKRPGAPQRSTASMSKHSSQFDVPTEFVPTLGVGRA